MPVPPVDVVTLSLAVKDVIKALYESRNSSVEYQHSINQLRALERILLEIEALCKNPDNSIEHKPLQELLDDIIYNAQHSVEAFRKRSKKFEYSLQAGGSGRPLRDAARRIQWQLFRSDDSAKFRADINLYCSIFGAILASANVRLMKLDRDNLHERIEIGAEKIAISIENQSFRLNEIKDELNENSDQVRSLNTVVSNFIESSRENYFHFFDQSLRQIMHSIYMVAVATYKVALDIRGRLPGSLERSLYQEPFVLEDSHLRVKPISMDCIDSWDAFDAWLEFRFRDDLEGLTRVQEKRYVLHDSASNRDIQRRRPWESAILPGQRIVMCMVFLEWGSPDCCPNCSLESQLGNDSDVRCTRCGTWYRREPYCNTVDTLLSNDDLRTRGPSSKSDLRSRSLSEKMLWDGAECVASFKRVRMVTIDHVWAKERAGYMVTSSQSRSFFSGPSRAYQHHSQMASSA